MKTLQHVFSRYIVVFGVILLSGALGHPVDYDEEEGDTVLQTREFMIPHPRLGRYMDYAVLKIMANYLKDQPNFSQMAATTPALAQPEIILQRDLRDMKGRGYGIPIPRVGKRSVEVEENHEVMPTAASMRELLSQLIRSVNTAKRQQPNSRSMFRPRVGRANSGKAGSRWGPVPRVG